MRDPGTARSNPLLGHETVDADEDNASDWKDPTAEAFPDDDWATLEDLLAPGSAGEAVMGALLEAGPEALEHLTTAGHELLLAAKTMIDAAERGLAEYRRLQEEGTDLGGTSDEGGDPTTNVTPFGPR